MYLAITANAHAYCVVLIQRLLCIVRELKILPITHGWAHTSATEVDIMVAITLGTRAVEGYVLVVPKRRKRVLLESKAVKMDGTFRIICEIPRICRCHRNSSRKCIQECQYKQDTRDMSHDAGRVSEEGAMAK